MRIFAQKSVSTQANEEWAGSWVFGSVSLPEGSYLKVLGGSLFVTLFTLPAGQDLNDAFVGVWGGAVPAEFSQQMGFKDAVPLAYASVLKQTYANYTTIKSGVTHFELTPRVGSLSGDLALGWASSGSLLTSPVILTFLIDLEVEIVKASTASLQAMIAESC